MPQLIGRFLSSTRFMLALASTLIFCFPIYWMIITSFKSEKEINTTTPTLWPAEWHWENYLDAFQMAPFGTYMLNTILMTVGILLLQLNFAIITAYAFAKGRFRGRDQLFLLVLAAMMIPGEVTFIPVYVMVSKLGWLNTFAGLIVPHAISAYGIFLLRQAFKSIDNSVIEAAQLDGANRWQILYGILVPMARPTVITLGIFIFIASWNSYFWPLIATNQESMRVLTVGIAMLKDTFVGTEVANWHLIMAGSVLTILPIVLLFIIAQRYIVQAMSNSTFR